MKLNEVFSFLLLTGLLYCATCESDKKSCRIDYKLEFPVTVAPALDTFKVGDTIWVKMTYPSKIRDLNNQNIIEVDSFDFLFSIGITKFTPTTINFYGIDYFILVENIGKLARKNLSGVSVYDLKLEYESEIHQISFGLVPVSSGNFLISFNSIINKADTVIFINSDCEEHIEILFKTKWGTDNNFELYKNNSPDEDVEIDGFKSHGGYAFVVIE